MMGWGEGTTKYAKSAKRQANLMFKDENCKQSNYLKATGKHLGSWLNLGHYPKPKRGRFVHQAL
jgi:hypothetical protein